MTDKIAYISAAPRHIPIELYRLIVHHIINPAVLSELCGVSRAFRHEAELILYRKVRLSNNYHRILSWCKVIIKNPRLAVLVHSLTLPTSYDFPKSPSGVDHETLQTVVKGAFSSLSRLRELYTYESAGHIYLNPEIFRGNAFQLYVFEDAVPNRYLTEWIGFLSGQPGIRYWKPNISYSIQYLPSVLGSDRDMLPVLTSVHVRLQLLDIILSRPIRALKISGWPSRSFLGRLSVGLKAFGPSLISLSLNLVDPPMVNRGSAPGVVEMVSNAVPNLKHLSLQTWTPPQLFDHSRKGQTADFLSALSRLPHLSSLVLELPPFGPKEYAQHQANFPGWCHDGDDYAVHNTRGSVNSRPVGERAALALANALMMSNVSLERVAIQVWAAWTDGRFPCYVRTGSDSQGDSVAVFEGFDILGPDSWRDV